MRRPSAGALLILFWLGLTHGLAAEGPWHPESGYRWLDLPVSQAGKTGFTALTPDQTGLFFTNTLDELSSAANRVLEDGSGVAVGDFDHDGRPDIFLCSLQGRSVLYRNLGGCKFADATLDAGIALTNMVCRGAVFADLNGDGWLDLLVSTLGHGVVCFMNDGAGKFTNATSYAGTETTYGSMTMALADVDGNGTLDLYVVNYRTDDIRDHSRIPVQFVNGKMMVPPQYQGRLFFENGKLQEYGEPDILYLNDGHGHFSPMAWTNGVFLDDQGRALAQAPADWGLTATFRDLNGDGAPDLYVCNDYWTPDRLWINDRRGHFKAIAPLAIRHTSENSMGVDVADIDRDGHPDILVLDMLGRDPSMRRRQALAQTPVVAGVGEIANRPQIMRNSLFHNRGDGTFEEIADFCGLPASDWSWQPIFLDVDLDGFEDLIVAAGHTHDVQDMDASVRIQALLHRWPKDIDPKQLQEAFTREMADHARLYPPLLSPIIAFRNLGNLKFQDVTSDWGTAPLGVHQGIALADFDGDGDLDLVVNNLNGVCGLYRNDTTAPRVAVRLKGRAPNTQGIGARIKLLGGALPLQSQEVVCGGRYLSGSDPVLVFAAGTTRTNMTFEVAWRSGASTQIGNVEANRLYEIDEPPQGQDRPPTTASDSPAATPIYQDISAAIHHTHAENAFDDFARQPLLPKRLSQLGPGLVWFDLDGDGHDDLVIGTGAGGRLAAYRGDGKGGFTPFTNSLFAGMAARDQSGIVAGHNASGRTMLLVGSANYEDASTTAPSATQYLLGPSSPETPLPPNVSSTGPMALADIDGDGVLELFVGGRVVPGRYPEPASSRIYRQDQNGWRIDEPNTRALDKVGLVSGAVWSDLDGDGYPELILACEWGPVRVFHNQSGSLHELTSELGLSEFTGWWSGVTTGDIDGDGNLDIIAANWGQNSQYRAEPNRPLQLFFGDFNGQGGVDILETDYTSAHPGLSPRYRLDLMAKGLPFLRGHFDSFRAFSEAPIDEVLGDLRPRAANLQVRTLASTLFLNRGKHFQAVELPAQAQFAPAFAVNVADYDGDGAEDVFLSQNFFDFSWEQPRLDAGRGLWLHGDGTGRLSAVSGQESGIQVYGEQRGAALADFNEDGRIDLAVSQNGAATKLYLNRGAKPGLRVRLSGPPGNPAGVGATLRLRFPDHLGPAREIHAGSGYWSQDSPIQVMSTPAPPSELLVRWPGGKTTTTAVPPGARELVVGLEGLAGGRQ